MIHFLSAIAAWEIGWWARRRARRSVVFAAARSMAHTMKRPLVVIGAPDRGPTSGYPCGDYTIDIAGSSCPRSVAADITKRTPFADDTVVVFCSCVLEYVKDEKAALAEIHRISGGHAFFVGVEPWTLTAHAYPGARRTLPVQFR